MKQNYNNSLAALGHGKWKSALRHTLLIIGMVLMAMGVYAQTPTPTMPDGLVMKKSWVEDPGSGGRSGNIFVETFVTGSSSVTHVPTDIVLVLDVSGSMNQNLTSYVYTARDDQWYTYNGYPGYNSTHYYYLYNGEYYEVTRGRTYSGSPTYYWLSFTANDQTYYLSGDHGNPVTTRPNITNQNTNIWRGVLYSRSTSTQTKMAALKTAVKNFIDIIASNAHQYNVDHRISIVKYAIDEYYTPDTYQGVPEAYLGEGDHHGAVGSTGQSSSQNYNYTEVVMNRRNAYQDQDDLEGAIDDLTAGGATAADYGMRKAEYVLAQIPANEERTKVVVMFTDGEPNHLNGFDTDVADATIENAYELKHSSSTLSGYSSEVTFDATVYTIGVFNNPGDDVLNYMAYTSSNYPDAHSMDNHGTATPGADYSFTPESADELNNVFTNIASASGALPLPASTIVQDMVSPSFKLPNGASTNITAYAPKCTGYDEDSETYLFDDIDDEGTLTLDGSGIVTGGNENKLPADFVTIGGTDNKQIQMRGFNFSEQWCGELNDGGTITYHGRKVVIKIPVVIEEGIWGDGLETNDPDNSYIYNASTGEYYGPFNRLTADVQSDVWTEVVRTKPNTFVVPTDGSPIQIGTPEDLAWFISYVNGRLKYEAPYNEIEPHWDADAILTADIDMGAHNWVPIGGGSGHSVGGYTGTFDGNGHVITGLKNNASKYFMLVPEGQQQGIAVVYPGMFSKVGENGVVKNVFVLDADFRGKHHSADFVHHGIIADTLLPGGTIFNCEAAGRLTCNNDEPEKDQNLVYGGLVGLNQGTIHSCMAMVELTGYTMGGMIGENGHTVNGTTTSGTFTNGFTNGVYNYIGTNQNSPVGGIAGKNVSGSISNCYVRFSRESSGLTNTTGFHQVVGDGSFTQESCYTPSHDEHSQEILSVNTAWNSTIPSAGESTSFYTNTRNQSRIRQDRSNDNMVGGTWSTVGEGENAYKILTGGTPLLTKLNQGAGSTYTPWKRTTAIGNNYHDNTSPNGSGINGDYPVLQLSGYTCLASTDGITVDYATSLDQMLQRHNTGNMNTGTHLPGAGSGYVGNGNTHDYTVSESEQLYGGAINLYANDETSEGTTGTLSGVHTVVYIDENVSLIQTDDEKDILAYTGQTIKDFGSSYSVDGNRWHNVSSSLEDSQFGWTYDDEGTVPHEWSSTWASYASSHDNRKPENPCLINMNVNDDDIALFPTDTRSYHAMDFYCFYEPEYHWINFKRNSSSHWHMNDVDLPINYTNETAFTQGKGYLLAIHTERFESLHTWNGVANDPNAHGQFLQNRGTLNNGDVTIPITYTEANEWTGLAGYNLLGNPYQSYLDFVAFVNGNTEDGASTIWNSDDTYKQTYAVYDPSQDAWMQYAQASNGSMTAGRYLNMHQGFIIQTTKGGTAKFTNDMRVKDATGVQFRGEQLNYPLINFVLSDGESSKDIAVLEVGRPENGGAEKLRVSNGKGRISLRHDNQNFAVLFRDMTEGSQPLYFDADEDGMFTLSWNTANADFRELTLVDNITGVRYDMLSHDHYVFEGHANDYRSRFKVVIGSFTGLEEEETVTNNFAFFDGSEWVVNGQGRFTVTDMMGRMVYSANLENDQNRVNLNGVAQGMYLMQVSNSDGSRVQKIVVR